MKPRQLGVLALGALLLSGPASAGEENLFGEGRHASHDQAEASPLRLVVSGVADFRFIRTGNAIGWEYAGPGLSRYGAVAGNVPPGSAVGQRPDATLKLPQVGMDLDVLLHGTSAAHVQLGYDDHPDVSGRVGSLGVVAAWASAPLPTPFAVRAGVFPPPLSLEHPGAAWSTLYTVTPSAINSWIGEELRAAAVEASVSVNAFRRGRLRLSAAAFSHNDPAGAILAWRGWALHDYQLKLGDALRVPTQVDPKFRPNGGEHPFKEVDGQPGAYASATLDAGDAVTVQLAGYHNLADQTRSEDPSYGHDYAWKTWFVHAGLKVKPTASLTLLAQAMHGNTVMGAAPVFDSDFSSVYALASYRAGDHRFSFRYDWFRVKDRVSGLFSQNGHAETVAYFYEITDSHVVGLEYLRITTERPGVGAGDPYDDLFQLAYRFKF